jgi:hypothetical protein
MKLCFMNRAWLVAGLLGSSIVLNIAGTSVADAAQTGQVRFGYVAPTATTELTQPALNRFASDVRRRLETAAAFSIVTLDAPNDTANLSACKNLHLSGFVEPHRYWRVTDNSVTVEARVSITDCSGNIFFRGYTMRAREREMGQPPQAQLDAIQAEATDALIQQFVRFKNAHDAEWEQLIAE